MAKKPKRERTRVVRLDGKPINLVKRRGHLMVCAKGCCCGRTDRGFPAVPVDFYKAEYKRRKLRNVIQLSMNGCLGPCPLANVVLLFFDGRPIWFQSVNTPGQIAAIFDYVEQMLAADRFLPPPAELEEYVFDYYAWTTAEVQSSDCRVQHGNANTTLNSKLCDPNSPLTLRSVLFLSHADTDLLTLHHAQAALPGGFPPVRGLSLGKVTSPEHMANLLEQAGPTAIVIARILGGVSSVPGFGLLVEHVRKLGTHLLALSGAGLPDPELAAVSTAAPAVLHEATAYLQMGGVANVVHCLRFLADHLLMTGFGHEPAVEQPQHGIYHPDLPAGATVVDWLTQRDPARPTVGLLFYRSHWLAGNLAFVDMLVRDIERQGANALPVFTTTLKECRVKYGTGDSALGNQNSAIPDRWPAAFAFFFHEQERLIDVVISTISFALGEINPNGPTPSSWSVDALAALNVPVVQAICASTMRWQWEASSRGLNPLDTAMNVALPEFDGRIITVPISFKEPSPRMSVAIPGDTTGAQALYQPDLERISRAVGIALRHAMLRHKPNRRKRIAFILTNSPGKASRIGNAVGLDAPASLMRILVAMQDHAYHVADVPADGDALIKALIDRCSYDETILTEQQLSQGAGQVSAATYARWFEELPEAMRQRMSEQWGPPPGEAFLHDGHLALAGLELGNVFIALQPPRGFGMDPNAIYHQPDLAPTHHYFAFYRWLRDVWAADAIVHLGKHGTLEWLPGKGVGLSADCCPDAFLGDLPLFYPFILNDPGEGAQAKRRSHAVIVDHLTPPMTSADAYGPLGQLMQLVDEYYQVEMLDPSKMPLVQKQIWNLIQEANLQGDLKFLMQAKHGDHVHEWEEALTADGTPITLAQMRGQEVAHLVQELDGYLCELAGAQIRDGLHLFGQAPEGEQLIGLLQALTRVPNLDVPSLPQALAASFSLDWRRLVDAKGERVDAAPERLRQWADRPLATNADVLEVIDELGRHLLELMQRADFAVEKVADVITNALGREGEVPAEPAPRLRTSTLQDAGKAGTRPPGRALHSTCKRVLQFVVHSHRCRRHVRTPDEIGNLLRGLDGEYVPAGPSGAPTRGMAHVLPTGRNFYSVDPRTLPSLAAWQVGQELAREVLERHRDEAGVYPETIGISIWGTSRRGVHPRSTAWPRSLAPPGVRPVWQPENRRLIGIEIIPLAELGRPRIDVTVRISGFFRDAFPHLIQLLDDAVQAVIAADEPAEQNYVRKHYLAELADAARTRRSGGNQTCRLPHLRVQAGLLWRGPADADRRAQLAGRCRSGGDVRQLGRLCV